jgi:amidohydrolase
MAKATHHLKKKAWRAIRDLEPELRDLALQILHNPELGYEEARASRWLCQTLSRSGFQVERNLGGLPTAFRACRSSGSGPTIAFLAEYDALPEVGHGCGHNLIGPAATGAALGLASLFPRIEGQACVIGTPAEEFLGQVEGKIKLLEAGVFNNIDVALMMHPQYAYRLQGKDLAFIAAEITFTGRAAHAAADPWNGANALDGLLLTYSNINALRQHLRPEIRVHGIITDGGQAPNIIPGRTSAQLMVRAYDLENLEAAFKRVQDCARAGALASGTQVEIVRTTTVSATRINQTLNRLIAANLRQLGVEVKPEPLESSGSSDFGNVSQRLPAAMFWAGSHPPGIPWHSSEVARASGEERALKAMTLSACAMAGVAIDLLSDRALLDQARRDFAASSPTGPQENLRDD